MVPALAATTEEPLPLQTAPEGVGEASPETVLQVGVGVADVVVQLPNAPQVKQVAS